METAALVNHSFIKGMGLTEKDIVAIADISESAAIEADTVIFSENDTADAVYLTTSGPVKITTFITQKLEKVLYTVPPDSVFGEMGVLDEGLRSATAKPTETSEIIKIPRGKLLEILESNAELGLKLVRGLYGVVIDRLRTMNAAYSENIRWGLEISGATKLDFSELISGDVPVEVALNGGGRLKGRIVKVVETPHDLEVTICTHEKLYIIPYGSIVFIAFATGEKFLEDED